MRPMKPEFALDLSQEAIVLLHRQKRGWRAMGAARLDDARLKASLTAMRANALAESPDGLTTKLILPDSQILYTSVSCASRDERARRAAIERALDGMTPYAIDELAFDYEGEGDVLHVAVVARETLDEAEGFAAAHGFNPVSIVARPRGGSFTGEPFFGATTASTSILPPGTKVERDVLPTMVTLRLTRPVPPTTPPVDPPAPHPAAQSPSLAPTAPESAGAAATASPAATTADDDAAERALRTALGESDSATPPVEAAAKTADGAVTKAEARPDLPVESGDILSPEEKTALDTALGEAATTADTTPEAAEPPETGSEKAGTAGKDSKDLPPVTASDGTDRNAAAESDRGKDPLADAPDAAETLPDAPTETALSKPEPEPKPESENAGDRNAVPVEAARPTAAGTDDDTSASIGAHADAEETSPADATEEPPEAGAKTNAKAHAKTGDHALDGAAETLTEAPAETAAETSPEPPEAETAGDTRLEKSADDSTEELPAPAAAPLAGGAGAAALVEAATDAAAHRAASDWPANDRPASDSLAVTSGELPPADNRPEPRGGPRPLHAPARPGKQPRPARFDAPEKLRKVLARPNPTLSTAPGLDLDDTPAAERAPRLRPSWLMLSAAAVAMLVAVLLSVVLFGRDSAPPPAGERVVDSPAPTETPADTAANAENGAPVPPAETAAATPATTPTPTPALPDEPSAPAEPSLQTALAPTATTPPPARAATATATVPAEVVAPATETAAAEDRASAEAGTDTLPAEALPEPAAEPEPAAGPAAQPAEPADERLATATAPETPAEAPPATAGATGNDGVGNDGGTPSAPAGDMTAATPPGSDEAAVAYAATGIWTRAPDTPAEAAADRQLAAPRSPSETPVPEARASTLDQPAPLGETSPTAPAPPPPAGVSFRLTPDGLVIPTPEGAPTPEGTIIYQGRPPVVPPDRPGAAPRAEPAAPQPQPPSLAPATDASPAAGTAATGTAATGTPAAETPAGEPAPPLPPSQSQPQSAAEAPPFALPGVPDTRPPPRPAALERETLATPPPDTLPDTPPATPADTAALAPPIGDPALAGFRPRARPATLRVVAATAAPDRAPGEAPDDATLDATASAAAAAIAGTDTQEAFDGATDLAVAVVVAPPARPGNFAERAPPPAETATPASASAPASPSRPEAEAEADGEVASAPAQPRLPTRANVAREATERNVLNLSRLNLIGIYGSSTDRRALVRLPSGRYVKVQVGDRLEGGRVATITERELRIDVNGRSQVLSLPRG